MKNSIINNQTTYFYIDRTLEVLTTTYGKLHLYNDQGQYYSIFFTESDWLDYSENRTNDWKRLCFEYDEIVDLFIERLDEVKEFALQKGYAVWDIPGRRNRDIFASPVIFKTISMYQLQTAHIRPNQITQYQILQNNEVLTYANVLSKLQSDPEFRTFFTKILSESPFEAYFWEVKSIIKSELNTPFEFVLVDSTRLRHIEADKSHFQSYFSKDEAAVSFPNLGRNAQLVVPTPQSADAHYNHLATFIRNAPTAQIDLFWKKVAEEFEKKLGSNRKWLSTSGLGVYWLHVRIDSRPKYYQYSAYK